MFSVGITHTYTQQYLLKCESINLSCSRVKWKLFHPYTLVLVSLFHPHLYLHFSCCIIFKQKLTLLHLHLHGAPMIGHLMLFLACFSVNFSRFYQQNRRVLDQLPMISRHLYCFLNLSS